MKKLIYILAVAAISLTSCTTRVVTSTPSNKVVVVKKAPRNHKVVVVKGQRYYYWNKTYHRKTAKGYVVVKV